MLSHRATFYSFKPSGKWYTTGRGRLTEDVFKVFGTAKRRAAVLKANDGRYPGLSGDGHGFIFMVVADDDCQFGYPLMLMPRED